MKKILLAVAIATAGLMTSCAVSEHLTSNRNVMQTNVELSKNNFQVIGTAQGSATVIRVFGIGGLSLKAIRANAYAEMVKNANLSGSQALINVNTEVKQRGVAPFYWKTVITTCGQVIEFISTEEQVSEHHAGTAKRFAPRTAETTMAEEIIVVDPIAKIKSNTICYTAEKDKPISVNIAKHPQFINNEYRLGKKSSEIQRIEENSTYIDAGFYEIMSILDLLDNLKNLSKEELKASKNFVAPTGLKEVANAGNKQRNSRIFKKCQSIFRKD